MTTLFSRQFGFGLVAAAMLAGAATPLEAAPLPQSMPAVPAATAGVTTVAADDYWLRHNHRWQGNDRWQGGNRWQRGERWQGGDRRWQGNGNWQGNGDWRRDRWWRHHRHHRYYGGGPYYDGWGWGLGLGMMVPSYDYYYVQPRRHYRSLSQAHVDWCYAHYRTYRAWDNSYVPRRGFRAQCRSPFG